MYYTFKRHNQLELGINIKVTLLTVGTHIYNKLF